MFVETVSQGVIGDMTRHGNTIETLHWLAPTSNHCVGIKIIQLRQSNSDYLEKSCQWSAL